MDSVHPLEQPVSPGAVGFTAIEAVFQADWMNGAAGPLEKYLGDLQGAHREAALQALQSLESELRSQPTVDLTVLESQAPGRADFVAPKDLPQSLHRYRIQSLLGQGGFGRVYLAYDPELRRPVAIKTLRTDQITSPRAVENFLEEGRKLARLKHRGIVTVYDVGGSGAACYFVSEFIEGGTLGALMQGNRITHYDAARIVADVADALHHAHLHGIIHRDIKPGNILMDRDRIPHLSDFGLAITEEEQLAERSRTVGTYAYMSPEQARGESQSLDARSDIYSLGTVFFQMLTRRLPFLAETKSQYLDQIVHRDPRPPRTIDDAIPPELERICLKCMARSINDRYTTARDLAADLRAFLGFVPSSPSSLSDDESSRRSYTAPISSPSVSVPGVSRTQRTLWILLGTSLLAVAAVAVWINFPGKPAETALPVAPGSPPAQPAAPYLSVHEIELDRRDLTSWEILKGQDTLRVLSEDLGLISLGDHSSGILDFAVTLKSPLKPTGTSGLFFGLTSPDEPESDKLLFHSIELETISDRESQLVLYRRVPFDSRNPPTRKHGLITVRNLLTPPDGEVRLRLRIDESRRLEITANGSAFPEFTDVFSGKYPTDPPIAGRFGLFLFAGTRLFTDPFLNDVRQKFSAPVEESGPVRHSP